MKPDHDPLDRLFKSAASAPRPETRAANFALETRVLRDWHAAAPAENMEFLVAWLRRATICACVLALASLALNYAVPASRGSAGDELAVADATMTTGVEP